ncbi:MAG: ATP-dependent DNA helicase, partial [Clostridium sp.]|uniref:ATP-dependent DNA helicase n=1 Tax=Clostridium sp. TaxID=1506 RepID=UPI003EE7FBF1
IENSRPLGVDWKKYIVVDGFELTEQQQGLLENFCKYSFTILAGYSGTGKTSSVVALIKLLEDNGLSYTCLAPTGRAASRMKECIHRPTSTLHRALAGDRVITTDVVIVDEFSFFGVELMQMLIRGIANDNTRIVLCGDNAQLSSIGCGRVFDDILESNKVPMSLLTNVFRYANGGILKVATDIRNGQKFLGDEEVQKFGDDYTFIQSDSPLDEVIKQYSKLIDKGVKPHEIMCLSPFNIGELGTLNINSKLQAMFNPAKPNQVTLSFKHRGHDVFYRKGDLVINVKNNYKAIPLDSWNELQQNEELDEDDVRKTVVYNGDIGYIRSVDEKKVVVEINEELVVYEKFKLSDLLLARAISSHKSQGSQSKYVINITSPIHERMLSRELLYVADSRSCGKHIEIGDVGAINNAIDRQDSTSRITFLKELLIEG